MQTKRRILVALHLFLFVSSLIITIYGVAFGFGVGQQGSMLHFGYFKTFTIDSNVFAGLVSLLVAIQLLKTKDDLALPRHLSLLQFAAAVSVGLTVLVVVVFLAPMGALSGAGYFSSFAGTMFFFHFFNPVLAGALFVYGNQEKGMGHKENFLGTIPLIIYAIYYVTTVIFLETMEDFYGFTFGGHKAIAPVSVAVIYAATYGIGCALRAFNRRELKKN